MSTAEESESSNVVFTGEGRPCVTAAKPSTFRVKDKVVLVSQTGSRLGPYWIAEVLGPGVYTLCFENGQPAEEGERIYEVSLEAAP
ncbi:hypothetical protein C7974DRAFT_384594 [Boeremia exigua]|uniref:uncharacterized protein n=1 Tax=Boeremia exigua TaxID=749465 RepID=UPI001E8CEDAA|nr:uncharacterized protein C7974DRAFT_384594 [Boeremia exigua]KAH6641969.1 hypothetical protein C7974DRAFT_384594 [Boeremia exigua]